MATVSSTTDLTLRLGEYVWVAEPSDNLVLGQGRFNTNDGSEISIQPEYTSKKLAQTLLSDRVAVTSAIQKKYPLFATTYTIKKDRMYGTGNWYGALLVPSNLLFDPVRIVLTKKAGGWEVATHPPHILLGAPAYPRCAR